MINNIVVTSSIFSIIAILYYVKNVLDQEKVLAQKPFVSNTFFRFSLSSIVTILILIIFEKINIKMGLALVFSCASISFFIYSYLYNIYSIRVQIAYSTKSEIVAPGLSISIPSDRYVTVAPGVRDRRVVNRFDKEFRMLTKDLGAKFNFRNNYVIIVRFHESGNFQSHVHPTVEKITMIKGTVQMFDSEQHKKGNIMLSDGGEITIPAWEPHIFKAKEEGICIIELAKR